MKNKNVKIFAVLMAAVLKNIMSITRSSFFMLSFPLIPYHKIVMIPCAKPKFSIYYSN